MPTLIAYEMESDNNARIVPAPPTQPWMADVAERAGIVCLPMRMATQSGWVVLNEVNTRMLWDGERIHIQHVHRPNVVVTPGVGVMAPPPAPVPTTRVRDPNFGSGIVTWDSPYLLRTSPGYNLLIRGPANAVKDGIAPLEALIESDWLPVACPINWKFTRPHVWVEFAKGEPLCQLVPQRRGELESFTGEIRSIDSDPELRDAHGTWDRSRQEFRKHRGLGEWRRDYIRNVMPDGSSSAEHQTRLQLSPMTECAER